jgi:hypothetical protein
MRRTRRNGAQNSNAKIDRQRSRHVHRPPSGRQSESLPARFGNPARFIQVGFRSRCCQTSQKSLRKPPTPATIRPHRVDATRRVQRPVFP